MLVLPVTPQLWQPRNGQWWRRPRWRAPLEWFAGHLQYGSGTGHLKRNASSGHLSHTCGSYVCDVFVGSSPASLTAVVSGVTICPAGCKAFSAFSSGNNFDVPDGTYAVPNVGGSTSCAWQLNPMGKDYDLYSGSTCAGSPTTTNYLTTINLTASTFIVEISSGAFVQLFYGTAAVSPGWDGTTPITVTNTLACPTDVGSGGTVDLSF